MDPLQVSEEESSGSEFPELEEDTSSDGEREETPARRQRPQGPVVWQCYVQPGEVVDFRLANGVPVVRSCGVANQGPAPRSERQSAGLATSGSSCGDWKVPRESCGNAEQPGRGRNKGQPERRRWRLAAGGWCKSGADIYCPPTSRSRCGK